MDPLSNRFTHYRADPQDAHSLSANGVTSIFGESNGVLWVGTYGGGLNRLNESNGSFERYQHDPDNPLSLSSNTAWAILEDKNGSLWVGTGGGGLNRWTAANPSFKKYRKNEGLSSDSIQAILED